MCSSWYKGYQWTYNNYYKSYKVDQFMSQSVLRTAHMRRCRFLAIGALHKVFQPKIQLKPSTCIIHVVFEPLQIWQPLILNYKWNQGIIIGPNRFIQYINVLLCFLAALTSQVPILLMSKEKVSYFLVNLFYCPYYLHTSLQSFEQMKNLYM